MINVTRSSMPEFNEYIDKIKELWDDRWLTNNGKNLIELETRLKEYLGVSNVCTVTNGTLALQISLELFNFETGSEIITTPFSFVATSSAIAWQKLKPIFVDIDKDSWNIDTNKIEENINSKTKAILATHVFGNPADVEQITEIAKKHDLKVIYDAAHCFGVEFKGKSIFKYGDVSIASFHATKVFHTIEGGAIFTENAELANKSSRLRNFGFNKEADDVIDIGINAKMNEFQAIMGLLNLKYVDQWIDERKKISEIYDNKLKGKVSKQKLHSDITRYNYIYYPVLFKNKIERDFIFEQLRTNGINTRKYFYPLINEFSAYNNYFSETPIAKDISERVLHLPLFSELKNEDIHKITEIINRSLKVIK